MQVFGGLKELLILVGLNADGSMEGDNKRTRIKRLVARIIAVVFLLLWVIGQIHAVILVNEKRLASVARPFNLAFAFLCLVMMYFCLMGKSKQIDILIDYMENVVSERKHCTQRMLEMDHLVEFIIRGISRLSAR